MKESLKATLDITKKHKTYTKYSRVFEKIAKYGLRGVGRSKKNVFYVQKKTYFKISFLFKKN